MNMFDDIEFRLLHRWITHSDVEPFTPVCNSIELLRSGQAKIECMGKTVDLQAPILFWLHRGQRYRFIFDKDIGTKPCDHLFCDCTGPLSDKMINWLESVCPGNTLIPLSVSKISETFFEMLKYYKMDKTYYHMEIVECFVRLMRQIMAELRPNIPSAKDPYCIMKTAENIRQNPLQNFDFQHIATEHEITYEHFRRLFRTLHRMPPLEYVRKQRISYAADLLSMTNIRIKDIMNTCRYDSIINFSRSFKRYFGISPREYRRTHTTRPRIREAEKAYPTNIGSFLQIS